MTPSKEPETVPVPRSMARSWRRVLTPLVLAGALVGCASPGVDNRTISQLPPLQVAGGTLTVADAANRLARPELLAVDEPMRAFVARYTGGQRNSRVRLMSLHQAVRGAAGLDMQYSPYAEGSAREVFHSGVANCLSYANLFVALAREAGLSANYQWVEVRPRWSRVSERVQVSLHVNVVVRLADGSRYMVDIDPPPSRDITRAYELTDSDAQALYYNNIAMDALVNNDVETAWLYAVNALFLSPANSHLWVNLGAIYRYSGQHQEAERSYLQALELDATEYSAMTNLVVLYGMEGREEDRARWLARVASHRQANPYYHAWQGEEAAAADNWAAALDHYNQAVALAPTDSHLLFSRGVIYYQLNEFDAATADIEKAIEMATLYSDIAQYQLQLEEVRKAQLAGAW